MKLTIIPGLQRYMDQHGISKALLAHASNVTTATIDKALNNQKIKAATALKICRAFNQLKGNHYAMASKDTTTGQ